MLQVQVQMLAESLASDARRTRTGRALMLIAVGLASALGLAGFAASERLVVQAAIYGWQTSDWDRLEGGSTALVPLLFLFLLPLVIYAAQPKVRPEVVRSILDALARGDAPLAPLAPLQPEPAADVPAGQAVTLRRLRQVPLGNARWRGLVIILAIVPMEFLMFIFARLVLLGVDSSSFQVFGLSLSYLELIAGLAALIGALGAFALLSSSSLLRLHITVDESGISWHSGERRKHTGQVHWDEVRAFYCMEYLPSSASPGATFIVDAGDHTFTWIIGRVAPRRDFDETAALARIIRLRTRLPLRDISELAVTVCQYQHQPDELLRLGMTPDAIVALQRLTYRSPRLLWLLAPVMLVIILGFVVPLVGVQRLEDYQRNYFASLPQKIHAETPIYFDSLAASDNQWDVEQPSKDNGEWSIGYHDGTYQLTGQSGSYVYSNLDSFYSDAAIEVTVVQRGKAADGNDGVGILLRADTDQNMVVYYVSPTDGSWSLSHLLYNPANPDDSWRYMDSGTSAFVQTGADASNTLLVLARGQTYLLYVNGHFLDAYTDRFHDQGNLLTFGQVGLYVNDGATTGIFSDFSVYPVQSPPSLSYV